MEEGDGYKRGSGGGQGKRGRSLKQIGGKRRRRKRRRWKGSWRVDCVYMISLTM